MKKFNVVSAGLCLSVASGLPSLALAAGSHGEHGEATLEITVEGNKARVVFEAPTEDIYGLASQAKTDAEKKQVEEAMTLLKSRMGEMIVLDATKSCTWTASEANPWVVHGEPNGASKEQHGEVEAKFDVACASPLAGTKVKFALKKNFKTINKISVKVSSGGKSTNTDIKRDRGTVTL